MKRLRAALGDDPVEPRYVETVARTGYVFIGAAVEVIPAHPAPAAAEAVPAAVPSRRGILAAGVGALAGTAATGGYIWNHRSGDAS